MLVTAGELSTFLKERGDTDRLEAAIRVAEAAVAAYVGADTLEERAVSDHLPVPRDRGMVELEAGPAVVLGRLAIDGADVDLAKTRLGAWSVWYSGGFAAGADVLAEYTAGWSTASLPENVRAAILVTAGVVWARPDLSIVRAAEASGTYRYPQDIMSPAAKSLVRRWRRPR